MTTIAWDGKTLAADRRSVFGVRPSAVRKVFRFFNSEGRLLLIGFSGRVRHIPAVLRWLKDRSTEKPKVDEHFSALIVDAHGRLWSLEDNLEFVRLKCRYYAIGSGGDFAEGAMAMGASAAEAVRIAAKHDVNTGNGVDEVRLR